MALVSMYEKHLMVNQQNNVWENAVFNKYLMFKIEYEENIWYHLCIMRKIITVTKYLFSKRVYFKKSDFRYFFPLLISTL